MDVSLTAVPYLYLATGKQNHHYSPHKQRKITLCTDDIIMTKLRPFRLSSKAETIHCRNGILPN